MNTGTVSIQKNNTTENFRRFLQDELIRRCKQNPRYSLRAFAKNMNISPALLSLMLSSKRSITKKMILRLGTKLALNPQEIEQFQNNKITKNKTDTADYKQIALDHFQVIADWYHYAILELLDVDNFEANPRWVAKTLGISINEVNAALERLQRLDMLEIDHLGKWKNISGSNTNIDNEFVAVARRKLQKQIIERAALALEVTPIERRDQSSMTMAIDSALIPEAKKRLMQFRRELTHFLQNGRRKDEVYNLSLSLYPLTEINLKKGAKK